MQRHGFESTMVLQALQTKEQMQDVNFASYTREALATSLSEEKLKKATRVILSGCGDSYASGIAAKHAFESLVGIPCDAISSVELSRYYDAGKFKDALVIFNSISGVVARVVEGARRANKHGGYTAALTANTGTKLSDECRTLVLMGPLKKSNPVPSTPKVMAYTASCAGLMHIAIYMAEVRGTVSLEMAEKMRGELFTYSTDTLGGAMDGIADACFAITDRWKDFTRYQFLGDGSDFAPAAFGAFKCPESLGRMSSSDDTENFNHVGYFMKDTDTVGTAIAVSAASPSMGRAKETMQTLLNLGRYTVAVTDAEEEFPAGVHVVRLPRANYPWMAAGFLHIPLALLAAYSHAVLNPAFVPYRNKGELWLDPGAARLTASEIVVL